MHDAVAGERLGKPSIGIMTEKFVSAADLMSSVLGAPGFQYVTIEHPISSADLDALAQRARHAVSDALNVVSYA